VTEAWEAVAGYASGSWHPLSNTLADHGWTKKIHSQRLATFAWKLEPHGKVLK